MQTFVFILILLAMLGVLGSLIYGLYQMSQEGTDHRRKSNKMMWMRVWLQGAAILLIFIFAGMGVK